MRMCVIYCLSTPFLMTKTATQCNCLLHFELLRSGLILPLNKISPFALLIPLKINTQLYSSMQLSAGLLVYLIHVQ